MPPSLKHVIQRASHKLVTSTPNYLEVTCLVGVTFAARLVMLPRLWHASISLCSMLTVLVLVFTFGCLGKGSLFRYFGWAAPRKPVYWLYAVLGGVMGATAALSLVRFAGHGPGRASLEVLFYGVTVGPLIEEVMYRGAAYSVLHVVACGWNAPALLRWLLPVLGSAGLFTLAHVGSTLLQSSVIFAMGLGYALLRWRSNSAAASTLMHEIYNLVVALMILRTADPR